MKVTNMNIINHESSRNFMRELSVFENTDTGQDNPDETGGNSTTWDRMSVTERLNKINEELPDYDPKTIAKARMVTYADGTSVSIEWCENLLAIAKNQILELFENRFVQKVFSYMNFYPDCSGIITTMATNGYNIFYSPGFVKSIYEKGIVSQKNHITVGGGKAALCYLLIHELCHKLFGDTDEFDESSKEYPDPVRQNYAQDYRINFFIENSFVSGRIPVFKGFTKVLGGMYSEKYVGMTWKEIYMNLPINLYGNERPKVDEKIQAAIREGIRQRMEELRAEGKIK